LILRKTLRRLDVVILPFLDVRNSKANKLDTRCLKFDFRYPKFKIIFFYKDLIEIPKLKKIILNLGYRKSNFKHLVSSLLALEFLTSKKGKITTSKRLSVFLKIKKGNPVGCKIILKKNTMYLFYLKLLTSIFSKIKQSQRSRSQ
jgi:ribosomal protein L5